MVHDVVEVVDPKKHVEIQMLIIMLHQGLTMKHFVLTMMMYQEHDHQHDQVRQAEQDQKKY